MKQETIEEAAIRLFPNIEVQSYGVMGFSYKDANKELRDAYIIGRNDQKQLTPYSKEDMWEIFIQGAIDQGKYNGIDHAKIVFEEFLKTLEK